MSQPIHIAGAIVIGVALVVVSILVKDGLVKDQQQTIDQVSITRSSDRHVYGDSDASVTIVEFSDVECPFCARLHPILEQVVLQSDSAVQWEYRHLPLASHKNAELGAYATECVARLGDEQLFWQYLKTLLAKQGSHSRELYVNEAEALGIDQADFLACLEDEKVRMLVAEDVATAHSLGAQGTPFSIVVFADGSTQAVSGALQFQQWQTLLQSR